MSTPQHPLTDETLDRLVSYISGGTIDCSSEEGRYDALSEDDARTLVESLWGPMMQAAQELPATPTEVTDEMVEAAARATHSAAAWPSTPEIIKDCWRRYARAALSAALAVAPPADPRHDPRPWEPLAPGDPLHAGDEVWRWWCGVSTRGIFDVQHPDSQVYTAERGHLGHRAIGTWCVRRRIPAPTPPAEEVELPGEHPAHLTGVESGGVVCEYMALDQHGYWQGVSRDGVVQEWSPLDLNAATHPEHGPIRRDGEHEDGRPRFVKVQEEEK